MVIGVVTAPDTAPPEPRTPEVSPPPVAGPPPPRLVVVALAGLMTLCVAVAFLGAFALGLSGLQEQRSQHLLYASFRGLLDPSSEVGPEIGGHIPAGAPVALINAPTAGLHNAVVVEGTSSAQLLDGPGHLPDSPLPGQRGDAIVVGKATTAGAPFRAVAGLRRGASVIVRTGQGRFRFTVIDRRFPGQPGPTVRAGGGLLTLVTASSPGWLGQLAPGRLVYVDAALRGRTVAAPPGRADTVPAVDRPGHHDPGAWPWVLVWAAVLVAAATACWALWARSGMLRAWIVGAPVVLAVLWALSTEAMRLLPNVV